MNISSAVVQVVPDKLDEVIEHIKHSSHYDYHLHDDKTCKVIVTIEGKDSSEEAFKLTKLEAVEGVLSVSLIMSYSEKELEEEKSKLEKQDDIPKSLIGDPLDKSKVTYSGDINYVLNKALDSYRNFLFPFESSYADSLEFIPIYVRLGLDLTGIKLSLKDWQDLDFDSRSSYLHYKFDQKENLDKFENDLTNAVLKASGKTIKKIDKLDESLWLSSLPENVSSVITANGGYIDEKIWEKLSKLSKYALFKLTRSSDNHNLKLAIETFGLNKK